MAKRQTADHRLGALLTNLQDQSAGAFPGAMEVVAQVIPDEGKRRLMVVPLDRLRPNPRQPRKNFVEADLLDLGNSIKEHGLQQPIVIRHATDGSNMYDIGAGERRWRAMLLVGLTEIEAIEVIGATDDDLETIALIENTHRADLTPMELAEAYWKLHRHTDGSIRMSIAEVADKVKLPKNYVDDHLSIMRAPEAVRQLIIDDPTIPLRTIRDLAQIENDEDRAYLIDEVRSHRFTANDISRILQLLKKAQAKAAGRSPQGIVEATSDETQGASKQRNISPPLAKAALEQRLHKVHGRIQKDLSFLAEEGKTMDAERKAMLREYAQQWIALAQQLWELTRADVG
jgi:ParB family transcriptional regulator, chromosome partitioning protein